MADSLEMQESLGMSGVVPSVMAGVPTQSVQLPQTMHPGQFAAMAVQQASIQAANTARAAMMFTPSAMAAQSMTSGIPAALGGGNPAVQAFSAQFSANYQGLQRGHAPLYSPGLMGLGPSMGVGGGLPMAGSMTAPEFGVYRSPMHAAADAMNYGGFSRPSTFNPLVFTPMTSQFASPLQVAQSDTLAKAAQSTAGFQTATSMLTQGALAGLSVPVGSSVGATLGAALGGVPGAIAGRLIGGIAAPVLTAMSDFSTQASDAVASSVTGRMTVGLHAQQLTRSIFNAGAGLAPNGVGLDITSSMAMAQPLQRMAYTRATGMNTADVSALVESAGAAGMMNDVGSVQQGADRLRQLSRAVRELMRITNDPEITSAMRELATMRNMGADVGQSVANFKAIRGFARMAGTSVQGIQEAANVGGLMFQGMGLPGATGLVFGAGAAGMARQAVATGTYSPQTLAMLGGEQGIAQRSMEAGLSFMRMPMMAAYGAMMMPGGGFAGDPRAVQNLVSGRAGLNDMVYGGLTNLSQAISRGGLGALSNFLAQQGEIQDDMARRLGPVGVNAVQKTKIIEAMRMMGLKGAGGFQLAAQSMLGDAQLARQLTLEVTNPEFMSATYSQVERDIQNQAAENAKAIRATSGPGVLSKMLGDPGIGRRFEESFITGAVPSAFNQFFGNYARGVERAEAIKRGLDLFQTPLALLPTSPEAAVRLRSMPADQMAAAMAATQGVADEAYRQAYDPRRDLDKAEAEALITARGGLSAYFSGMRGPEAARLRTRYIGQSEQELSTRNEQLRAELVQFEEGAAAISGGLGATPAQRRAETKALRDSNLTQQQINQAGLALGAEYTSLVRSKVRFGLPEGIRRSELEERAKKVLLAQGVSNPTAGQIQALIGIGTRGADFTAAPALAAGNSVTTSVSSANQAAAGLRTALVNAAAQAGQSGITNGTVFVDRLTGTEEEIAYLGKLADLPGTAAEKELIALTAGERFAPPEIRDQILAKKKALLGTMPDLNLDEFRQRFGTEIEALSIEQGPAMNVAMAGVSGKGLSGLIKTAEDLKVRTATSIGFAQLITPTNVSSKLLGMSLGTMREKLVTGRAEDAIEALKAIDGRTNDPRLLELVKIAQGGGSVADRYREIQKFQLGQGVSTSTPVSQVPTAALGTTERNTQQALMNLQRAVATGRPDAVFTSATTAFAAGVGQFAAAARVIADASAKTSLSPKTE